MKFRESTTSGNVLESASCEGVLSLVVLEWSRAQESCNNAWNSLTFHSHKFNLVSRGTLLAMSVIMISWGLSHFSELQCI